MRKIIGICGLINSGKDTAADFLCDNYGFRRDSFASTLKDVVSVVFGWDRQLLEGRTAESRAWREQVDTWWANRLDMPNLTPRWILQHWGTEVCRGAFHDDIWISCLESKLNKTTDDIVVTDVRFPNEIAAIRRSGGVIVRVIRGADPEWFLTAVLANNGDKESLQKLVDMKIHPSEHSWAGYPLDSVIENNSTLEQFHAQISILVENLELDPPVAKANLALEVCVDNWHKLI